MLDLIEDDAPFRGKLSKKDPPRSSTSGSRRGFRANSGGRGGARSARGNNFQRAVVKIHSTKMGGTGVARAKAHAKYLERDGVGKDGEEPKSFNQKKTDVDLGEFIDRCKDDRHMFRVILSPEAGEELDLEKYTKDLMAQVESDLKTKLEWAAVAHYNTDNPHVHLMMRGVDRKGKDLFINKDYLTRGIRERAREIATNHIGPRTQAQIQRGKEREILAERFTSLDRALVEKSEEIIQPNPSNANEHSTPSSEKTPSHSKSSATTTIKESTPNYQIIDMRPDHSNLGVKELQKRALLLRRLQALETMGLAKNEGANQWKIPLDMKAQLKSLALQKDIIRRMYAAKQTNPRDWAHTGTKAPPLGLLVGRGLSDDHKGIEYLIVEAADGKVYHLDQAKDAGDEERPNIGDIVSIKQSGKKPAVISRLDISPNYEGPVWIDRELIKNELPSGNNRFARDLKHAMRIRRHALEKMGVIKPGAPTPSNILKTMRARERAAYSNDYAKRSGKAAVSLKKGDKMRGKLGPLIELNGGKFHILETSDKFAIYPSDRSLRKHAGALVEISMKASAKGRIRPRIENIELAASRKEAASYVLAYASIAGKKAVGLQKESSIRGTVSPAIHLEGGIYHTIETADNVMLLPTSKELKEHEGAAVELTMKESKSGQLRPKFESLPKNNAPSPSARAASYAKNQSRIAYDDAIEPPKKKRPGAYLEAYAANKNKQPIHLSDGDRLTGKVSAAIELKDGAYHTVESRHRVALLRTNSTLEKSVGAQIKVEADANKKGQLAINLTPHDRNKEIRR